MSTKLSISFCPENLSKLEAIRPERRASLIELFRGDADKDAARIAARFATDCVFQIGALPPAVGRDAVVGMLTAFFAHSPFVSIEHELLEVYDLDEALLWRANAVYGMPDGSAVVAPYLNRVRFEGGLCKDYRVHVDLSALRPPAGTPGGLT